MARIAVLCGFLVMACHGGSVDDGAALYCDGAAPSVPDVVRFDCPGSSASPMPVRVMIGHTSSTDVYGVKFDVVFDPAIVAFSGPAVEGDFLNGDGNPTLVQADVQPADPGRLIVSVTRLGAVGGLGVIGSEETMITLPFSRLVTGTTTLSFENGAAVDPSLATIPEILFGGPVDLMSP
jgi:hypothetical protein